MWLTARSFAAAQTCNRLVTGSSDKTVKVWDMRMFGECLNTLEGHTDFVSCLSFAGDLLVSGSDDCSIRLWDVGA
jgi:WD40 repeat protein